ncbi:type II secretion system protein [Candidatus Falkowbacteria bacterium]|nr:type II secretion system protein [Candidatus Falkowbacteria bacterium]
MKFNKNKNAFTLIELLVVIAIIALLSVITFAVLNSSRERARAARIISDIKNIETAMHLYMDSNNYNIWPRQGNRADTCITPATCFCAVPATCACGANPDCAKMTDDYFADLVTLGYLAELPTPGLTAPAAYSYLNAGDLYPNDGTGPFRGVNILVRHIDEATNEYATYLTRLDELVDGGDGRLIGKIRGNGINAIYYNIATHELVY